MSSGVLVAVAFVAFVVLAICLCEVVFWFCELSDRSPL